MNAGWRITKSLSVLTVIPASMAFAGAALGQAVPTPPAPPPVFNRSAPVLTREQSEPPPTPTEIRKPEVTINDTNALPDDNCSLLKSDVRIHLREVQFSGVDGAAISPVLQGLLGLQNPTAGDGGGRRSSQLQLQPEEAGDQPISVVCHIRDRVNGALAGAGYIARVLVPPQEEQKVQDGLLRLVLVVGRVTEVHVRGDLGHFARSLDARLERIRKMDPFSKDEAIRILLEANDIPGLRVRLSLRNAGTTPGALIAEVDASAQTALVLANVQNYGSTQLGREIATVRAEVYGLTGLADRTYLSVSNSLQFNEVHIGQIGHDFAFNNKGLRFAARLSLAQSQPSIPNLSLRSQSLIGGLEFSGPLLRRTEASLTATGGFEVLNQATRVRAGNTQVPFTHDRTRVVFARIDGDYRSPKIGPDGRPIVQFDGYVELRKGVGILGSTQTGQVVDGFAPSRFEGVATATVLRGELSASVIPLSGFTLAAKAFGQYSDKPLLNLEQFSIGNLTYGRGFDPGANSGDRALALRVEPRLALGRVGPVDIDASGFYDIVHIRNLASSAGTEASRTFHSTGGGMRFIWRDKPTNEARVILEITYAKPLDKAVTFDQARPPQRVLVSLTTKLWPWGAR